MSEIVDENNDFIIDESGNFLSDREKEFAFLSMSESTNKFVLSRKLPFNFAVELIVDELSDENNDLIVDESGNVIASSVENTFVSLGLSRNRQFDFSSLGSNTNNLELSRKLIFGFDVGANVLLEDEFGATIVDENGIPIIGNYRGSAIFFDYIRRRILGSFEIFGSSIIELNLSRKRQLDWIVKVNSELDITNYFFKQIDCKTNVTYEKVF